MARKTNAQRAQELANTLRHDLQYDPLVELVKLAKHSRVDASLKKQIACELMQYIYPKQKAVELDQSNGQPVIFNVDLGASNNAANVGAVAPTALTSDIKYAEAA